MFADFALLEPLCVNVVCSTLTEVKSHFCLFYFITKSIQALLQSSASRKTQKKKKKKVSHLVATLHKKILKAFPHCMYKEQVTQKCEIFDCKATKWTTP